MVGHILDRRAQPLVALDVVRLRLLKAPAICNVLLEDLLVKNGQTDIAKSYTRDRLGGRVTFSGP